MLHNAVLTIFVTGLFAANAFGVHTRNNPQRVWDLRQYGYSSQARDYSTVGFLSEDLLLVAINQAPDDSPHPLFEETPDAILVLFDVSQEKPQKIAHMPMSKSVVSDAVMPALGGNFLVLSLSEVKLCSADLQCDRAYATKGPLWLSADRAKVVVGGNLMTKRVVLDSRTLAPMPGEDPARVVTDWQEFSGRDGSFVDSISTVDGARVMQVETRQSRWSKITNPLGGLGSRPYDRRIIRVYDTQTGRELLTLRWDPRHDWGGMSRKPALSPNGHRVALLRRGVVEVFEVPQKLGENACSHCRGVGCVGSFASLRKTDRKCLTDVQHPTEPASRRKRAKLGNCIHRCRNRSG